MPNNYTCRCSVPGCRRRAYAPGGALSPQHEYLCDAHYKRAMRRGSVGDEPIEERRSYRRGNVCAVPWCNRAAKSVGMCLRHYGQSLRGFIELDPRSFPRQPPKIWQRACAGMSLSAVGVKAARKQGARQWQQWAKRKRASLVHRPQPTTARKEPAGTATWKQWARGAARNSLSRKHRHDNPWRQWAYQRIKYLKGRKSQQYRGVPPHRTPAVQMRFEWARFDA